MLVLIRWMWEGPEGLHFLQAPRLMLVQGLHVSSRDPGIQQSLSSADMDGLLQQNVGA